MEMCALLYFSEMKDIPRITIFKAEHKPDLTRTVRDKVILDEKKNAGEAHEGVLLH